MKLDCSIIDEIVQSVFNLNVSFYECIYTDHISNQLIFSLKCESKVYFINLLKSFDFFSCHLHYDFDVIDDVFSLKLYISPEEGDEDV